jgi:hypothetical protein
MLLYQFILNYFQNKHDTSLPATSMSTADILASLQPFSVHNGGFSPGRPGNDIDIITSKELSEVAHDPMKLNLPCLGHLVKIFLGIVGVILLQWTG